jgi:hypothetical protein
MINASSPSAQEKPNGVYERTLTAVSLAQKIAESFLLSLAKEFVATGRLRVEPNGFVALSGGSNLVDKQDPKQLEQSKRAWSIVDEELCISSNGGCVVEVFRPQEATLRSMRLITPIGQLSLWTEGVHVEEFERVFDEMKRAWGMIEYPRDKPEFIFEGELETLYVSKTPQGDPVLKPALSREAALPSDQISWIQLATCPRLSFGSLEPCRAPISEEQESDIISSRIYDLVFIGEKRNQLSSAEWANRVDLAEQLFDANYKIFSADRAEHLVTFILFPHVLLLAEQRNDSLKRDRVLDLLREFDSGGAQFTMRDRLASWYMRTGGREKACEVWLEAFSLGAKGLESESEITTGVAFEFHRHFKDRFASVLPNLTSNPDYSPAIAAIKASLERSAILMEFLEVDLTQSDADKLKELLSHASRLAMQLDTAPRYVGLTSLAKIHSLATLLVQRNEFERAKEMLEIAIRWSSSREIEQGKFYQGFPGNEQEKQVGYARRHTEDFRVMLRACDAALAKE